YWRLAEAITNFPDERSMMEIRRHGTNYIVVHGTRLRGNRYETLTAALDVRDDVRLVSRRPWYELDKHSSISVYRILPLRIAECGLRNDCSIERQSTKKNPHSAN